jgi:hypothetical protein
MTVPTNTAIPIGYFLRTYASGITPAFPALRVSAPWMFVRFERRFADRFPHIEISDYGDADPLPANRGLMNNQAQTLLMQDITLDQDLWGDWLGQYHNALRIAETVWQWSRWKRRGFRAERAFLGAASSS